MPETAAPETAAPETPVLAPPLRAALMAAPAAGAALVLAVAGRAWRTVGSVSLTGDQLTGGLVQGLGLLSVAAWALLLVVGGAGRRVVGALLAVIGAGLVAVVVTSTHLSPTATGAHGVTAAAVASAPLHAPGWLAVVAAALLMAGGAALAVLAGRWPSRRSRFTRTVPARPEGPRDAREVWAAMDRGEDPTAGPGEPQDRP